MAPHSREEQESVERRWKRTRVKHLLASSSAVSHQLKSLCLNPAKCSSRFVTPKDRCRLWKETVSRRPHLAFRQVVRHRAVTSVAPGLSRPPAPLSHWCFSHNAQLAKSPPPVIGLRAPQEVVTDLKDSLLSSPLPAPPTTPSPQTPLT